MAAGRSREADPARCRRHPKHRHAAGVCPFCLRDRLSRLSAAAAAAASGSARAGAGVSASASPSSASSPCASWEETVALSSAHAPRPRRGSLGLLLRQEGREAAALAVGRRAEQDDHQQQEERERTARRGGNFWARLQQQLQHGGWHRKDGCSAAADTQGAPAAAAPHRRAPVV